MKKFLFAFVVSFKLLGITASGQSLADIRSPKITPPAPEAAGLGKYGQIPVDKSTGIPQISIPIYEIKTARFTLPISLSYHASGIKVDETAPWVGIGWSLNAGGVVTRTIMGTTDDSSFGFLNVPIPTVQSIYMNFHLDSTYVQGVCANQRDSQPDNFFYNFSNESGAFVFDAMTKKPDLIPYKPILINFNPTVGSTSFTIVDEQGNTYLFNDKEMAYSAVSNEMTGVSSWYLSQMVSADKTDTIKFSYAADPGLFTDNSYSYTQDLGPGSGTGGLWPVVRTINQSQYQQIHLTSIIFKGGRVDFKPKSGRKDNAYISLDSVIVSSYDFNQKTYSRLKSFKLNTDYFYSSINNQSFYSDSVSKYRLRLSGLTESDKNNARVGSYQFSYNTTMLPPVHNFGQDTWGYYNGAYGNPTLLQAQTFLSNYGYSATSAYYVPQPVTYVIGSGQGGDRSVSASSMQAGMLQQITYPSGGNTIFTFEPNQYLTPVTTNVTTQAFAIGVYRDSSIVAYTPLQDGVANFHVHINSTNNLYNNAGSYVKLVRVADGALLYSNSAQTNVTTDLYITPTLSASQQYQLIAVAIGGTGQTDPTTLPEAYISITYPVTSPPQIVNVGGLRVKAVKNYDSVGTLLSTEIYKYGLSENGAGDFLTSSSLQIPQSTHMLVFNSLNVVEQTYSNNSAYPLSSLNGSPVAYDHVTVYHGDTVNNIGKSIYQYTIVPDSILQYNQPLIQSILSLGSFGNMSGQYYWVETITPYLNSGIWPVTQQWKMGDPISESYYRNAGNGQYLLRQQKIYTYNLFYKQAGMGLHMGYLFENGANFPFVTSNDFIFYNYPISAGSRLLQSASVTDYADDGVTSLASTQNWYYYDNHTHLFPTRSLTLTSKGDSLTTRTSYPQDMVNAGLDPTGIYTTMTADNILIPAIKVTNLKDLTQLAQSITAYGLSNGIVEPLTISLQKLNFPAEPRLSQTYDNSGNLATALKPGGPATSYSWGYKGLYPVAEVSNAVTKDIFFESFEDGNGNSSNGDAKTGHYSHTGSYSRTLLALDTGSYILSYWLKSGSTWSFQVLPETVSSGSYAINLNAQVDDIRFYPSTAQMTTYTYDPLIGLTSSTDAKGKTTYYEYDSFQRLLNIKDQYGNVVKHMSYHYQGQ